MHLIGFLVIGVIAGWLAGKVTKGSGFGFWGDMGIGVVGAFLGGVLFRVLGLGGADGGLIGSLVVATIGAVVLLLIIRLVKPA